MSLQLQVSAGDHFHKVADLADGAEILIGRGPDNDLSFEHDLQMSGRHLKVACAGGTCTIEDLGSTNGSYVAEEPITSATLEPGDTFRCGETLFQLIEAAVERSMEESEPPVNSMASSTVQAAQFVGVSMQIEGFLGEAAPEIVEKFKIEVPIPPEPRESPAAFAERLVELNEPNHCVTFLSYALAKRAAVWWLAKCVEMVECLHDERDEELLKLVHAWVLDPTDKLRRQLMAAAEDLEMATPICWAGVGAFWSGGSMAPADCPVVEPAEEIFGKAISGGVILASVFRQPEKAMDKQKVFTELGLDIASGKVVLEPDA